MYQPTNWPKCLMVAGCRGYAKPLQFQSTVAVILRTQYTLSDLLGLHLVEEIQPFLQLHHCRPSFLGFYNVLYSILNHPQIGI